jgi:uncharacterized membrane protein
VASESGTPVDLYIVTYSGREGAQTDWADIKRMVKDKVLAFDALVLVSRGTDGKIEIEDDAHATGGATAVGTAGGLLVGVIFPPSLLVSGLVGAGIGAGVGGLRSHAEKREIKAEIEDDLPPGTSAIVGLFGAKWAADIFEKSLPQADKVIKHEVDPESAERVKTPASA